MSTQTLLLRLKGPLQSWGIGSKFDIRKTEKEPTKSGVIGMVAAAMGIARDDDAAVERLARMHFGVRVDQEGQLLKDYQTVQAKNPYATKRYYLSDASFLVGLESEDELLLHEIEEALSHPAFPLFLGRRSCPPSSRMCIGIREKMLEDALTDEPLEDGQKQYRIVVETRIGEQGILRRDQPVSYNPMHRKFTFRQVKEYFFSQNVNLSEHDPMEELG